ncbi:MAG: group II intron reverse transcriptase/maturase [Sulfobacillus benefaciens]|uniref:Group II intron reverse transcriptase/maturase n=1 Tax=Sulfobacillus benefaciens TaxID=453960 RepID=A0A2T2WHW1_9FIRM|nr:MAG: group II intron reverse transcriptase/maturase [Sulfobacillus benefaciens]
MTQRKWYSLADKVWSSSNLALAAGAVVKNHGAAGVDHQSCEQFAEHLDEELEALQNRMRQHDYHPLPVRRVYIPKPGTHKQRPLGVPTVRDRVVEEAMRRVLEPLWEPTFSPDSYGFRPRRSAQEAATRIYGHLTEGYHWVVDADIQDYFGSIDQALLLDKVAERVADGTVLGWIRDMLRAGVWEGGQFHPTPRGTTQGSVLSPLLANIYLDTLDQVMAMVPDIQFIRYADDWCALARTSAAAQQALNVAKTVLADLHLALHPEKTRIVDVHVQSFDFLGFTFFWTRPKTGPGRPLFGPKQAAIARFKDRIRLLTKRTRPLNIQMVIEDLAPVIRGWGQYFTISQAGEYYRLDAWIRERCRAFIAKHWNRNPQLDWEWTNQRLAHLGLPSLALMRRHVFTQSPRP